MDESITRSAGASHGQEMTPAQMEAVIRSLARTPRQRNTLYETVPEDRYRASFAAHAGSGRGRASATTASAT
jgi:FO synthase